MILVLDEALFEGGAVTDTELIALLRLIAVRGHGMVVATRPQPSASSSPSDAVDRWRARLGSRLNREVQLLVERSQNVIPAHDSARPGTRVLVSNRWETRSGNVRLSLKEAILVLSEPLHILVENGLRDAEFLRRVLPPDWAARLSEWEKTGRVRFEHAGGLSEMYEIVAFMTDDAGSQRTWGMPAGAWSLLHYLIFDHDGDIPSRSSSDASALKAKCESVGLADRFHMLERRCQEYYLPREAMKWIASDQVSDPASRQQLLADLERFFGAERTHGPLPALGTGNLWKSRFWRHRNAEWPPEWFANDRSENETRRIAESIERCL